VHHISCEKSCDSQHDFVTTSYKGGKDLCPGCNDDNEAPISYYVLNYALVKNGVIHQWKAFFQKGGWSVFEDHTEIRSVKYPWLRARDSF